LFSEDVRRASPPGVFITTTDEELNEMDIENQDEREYPHWNRVYITVIIYTIALIVGLWAVSRAFQ
jgi:hypothetical protein